ncbi:HNH endonuclease [Enterococcus entomosocium]
MRFYNSKPWRTLSKQVLNENYYVCCVCGGDAALADHIVPIRVDWERRLDKNNIQPLCDSCHTIKTKKETKK